VIDAPPGTGDEPLSVAQTVSGARAVILTTPQEVALADVRKSIHFCRLVGLDILGLVENMGPFPCPCCGKPVALFKSGGGERTAAESGIVFLGTLPFDPGLRRLCDEGHPSGAESVSAAFGEAMEGIIHRLTDRLQ
jgi:Mrp family chromosome partitioning ATPase